MELEELELWESELRSLCFDEGQIVDPKPAIRKMWEEIKNNIDILDYATKLNSDKTDFMAPTIVSLALFDYENIDSLLYNVLIHIIYEHEKTNLVCRTVNPFLADYKLSYLVSTLFNDNLKLTNSQKEFLVSEGKKCFGASLCKKGLYYTDVNQYINEYGFDWVSEMAKEYPAHGVFPVDIRYFILNHPLFSEDKETLFDDFYPRRFTYQLYGGYFSLMKSYKERVKLRNLKNKHLEYIGGEK